jgi:poly-gamma-glutamate capsule biosynthesis protein CapA/YwtB (metallophosphatase superfamily)
MREFGDDYPFRAVSPILSRTPIVLGNLEGPLAKRASRTERNFSYRVPPATALAMRRAGINVVTLANNHLVDCGRKGVLETLEAVESAGVVGIGAGRNIEEAHRGAVLGAWGLKIGLLGYYWNRRCAATATAPGSAMDPPDALRRDIAALRGSVDRLVVAFHWGIPYEREPSAADREKARLAIELGADAVVGHHPHVMQPFELHQGKPIFYSVGNFTFGSGNSRGEGLVLAFDFGFSRTRVAVYPLYVKNRDPRVAYQPKVLRGRGARTALERLVDISGPDGASLVLQEARGILDLPIEPPRAA